MLAREEVMWKQRARTLWLKERDKNSSYFHKKASSGLARNTIKGLEDANGVWQTSEENIENIAVNFYQNLFSTEGITDANMFLDGLEPKVSQHMNDQLLAAFTPKEVSIALRQMHPLKALGPDGLPALFYQKYWDIVGADITKEVLCIFNSGHMPQGMNHTYLALISKEGLLWTTS